jgi:hypothetical protein
MITVARRPLAVAALLALSLSIPLVACTDAAADGLGIVDAWARTSPTMATAGAAYMDIVNDGEADDALVSARVDATVAARVEMHETVPSGSGGMGASPGAMMEMRPVERIELPAGETVSLEPGGFHLMLIDLAEPLAVGGTVQLTLTFEGAGEMTLTVDVLETAP